MGKVVGEPYLKRDRKNRTSGNYYIYWTDSIEGSKEKTTNTTVYAKANKKFVHWQKSNIGVSVAATIDDVMLGEILDHYLDDRLPKVSDPDRITYSDVALRPFWAGKTVATVSRITCKEYEEYRFDFYEKKWPNREPLSINTIRRELGSLSAALRMAYKDRLFDTEVFVSRPPEQTADIEYFKCNEALSLIRLAGRMNRAKNHLQLFLQIGFLTGRRKDSILTLKWADINFEKSIINWEVLGKVITNKRRPKSRLPKRLRKHLLIHRQKFPDDEYVISYRGKPVKDIKTAFKSVAKLFREEKLEKHIKEFGADGSVDIDSFLPTAYPHMMRHSCATWMMEKGVNKREACQFLGMTEDTLVRRYWHHHPDFQGGAADAI